MTTRLLESTFKTLQKAILKGDYAPGSRFPAERDLAESLGVSRSTVREAVGRLEKSGLVETRPQSGTYVSDYQTRASLDLLIDIMQNGGEVDSDVLLSLMETRILMELHAVRSAVPALTDDDWSELDTIIEEERGAGNDAATMAQCDYRLHQLIMKRSGNIIIQLIFNSFKPVYRFYTGFFFSLSGAIAETAGQHRRFADAAKRKDVRLSEQVMREALEYGQVRVIEALGIGIENRKIRLVVSI